MGDSLSEEGRPRPSGERAAESDRSGLVLQPLRPGVLGCVQTETFSFPTSWKLIGVSRVSFRIKIEEEYAKNLSKLSQSPLAVQEEG